jgi:CDP-glucose 4,6-dehydratase
VPLISGRASADRPVAELVQEILRTWPGQWEQAEAPDAPHEAEKLNLAIDKAAAMLRWFPTWHFEEAVLHTATWYYQRHMVKKSDMVKFSLAQIESFTNAARRQRRAWADTSLS